MKYAIFNIILLGLFILQNCNDICDSNNIKVENIEQVHSIVYSVSVGYCQWNLYAWYDISYTAPNSTINEKNIGFSGSSEKGRNWYSDTLYFYSKTYVELSVIRDIEELKPCLTIFLNGEVWRQNLRWDDSNTNPRIYGTIP